MGIRASISFCMAGNRSAPMNLEYSPIDLSPNSEKGDLSGEGRLGEKSRADGQKSDKRPTGCVKVAQHTEGVWYAPGGKSGGSAMEQRAITWGGLIRLKSG